MGFLGADCPVFIARLGGLPVSIVEGLAPPYLREALHGLLEQEALARTRCVAASEALYSRIGAETDAARRSALLQARRDLYNGRIPRASDCGGEAVREAIAALQTCSAMYTSLREKHAAALRDARANVRAALENPRMREGLLLSSATLFGNVRRYMAASCGRLAARDLQVERGLLRYLTRASAKATPFAAFCTVLVGSISEAEGCAEPPPYQLKGTLESRRSVVRLNKALYGLLWEHVKRRPQTRPALTVEINPTLRADGAELRFLAGLSGREIFQRVERNEALALVTDVVRALDGCRYEVLVDALAADERIEASPDEARQFLDALLDMGLLRFRSPVPAQVADWAEPLARVLDGVDDPHAACIVELLSEADAIAKDYAVADWKGREVLGQRLTNRLHETLDALELRRGTDRGLALYEDCGADVEMGLPRTSSLDRALGSLRRLIGRQLCIANLRTEKATMRHFYDRYYGADREAVSLLDFYEDYYREHFRDHVEKERRSRRRDAGEELKSYNLRNPFGLSVNERIFAASKAWTDALRKAWAENPDAEEIHVAPEDVPEPTGIPPLNPGVPRSVAVFCQLVPSRDGAPDRLVVRHGQTYPGFGKFFSRFLHVVPPGFTAILVERNAAITSSLLAEIGGDANFNANLHPQLLPWQVSYPTGDGESGTGVLSCTDLVVKRDPVDPIALCLYHEGTGQRVEPLDLGFLSPMMRPALYQLLMRFAPCGVHAVALPESLAPQQGTTATEVIYRPRIVYDQSMVLARRRWSIPSRLFPGRTSSESEFEYFVRLSRWRHALRIPPVVYVRVMPLSTSPEPPEAHGLNPQEGESAAGDDLETTGKGEPDRNGRKVRGQSRDFGKPQFIDFESPLLAELFGRLPATLDDYVVHIEERYPEPDGLPQVDGQRYAAELILQLDWPGA